MQNVFVPIGLVIATALGLSAPASAADHSDPRVGFQISPPKGWKQIPTKPNEAYVVAKYKSEETQHYFEKDTGRTWTWEPELTVLVFLNEEIKKEEAEVEGDEMKWTFNPFPTYDEYLKVMQSGFYQLSDPENGEQSGVPVEKREYSVQDGKMRLVAWVFTLDIGTVAVQMNSLESDFDKAKKEFQRTLKSFKTIPRTEDLDSLVNAGKSSVVFGLDELDPAGRKLRRQEMEREQWDKAKAGVTEGWTAFVHKDVPILTSADEKHAKKMAEQVRAVMTWMEANFADIGKGEYVRTPILRVCKDDTEYSSFQSGFSLSSNEIVTYKSTSGATSVTWENVNRSAMRAWFRDRDRFVYSYLPPWLAQGLLMLVGVAQPKGSGLEFPEKDTERHFVRLAKGGDITPCRTLMTMSYDEYNSDVEARLGESFALTRFFLDGAGSKNKKTRNVLATYLANLRDVVTEHRAAELERLKAEGDKKAETEEEEEEMEKREQELVKANRQKILDETVARTFGSWTDEDWADLDNSYKKSF